MNLITIPFHDWRKSEKEGFRTRDVQFIKTLANQNEVKKILVVNRPITWLELLYKKQKKNLNGKIILKKRSYSLTQVGDKIFVADFYSSDIINQFFKRHRWFIDKYDHLSYETFIEESCKELNMHSSYLITQNIFSYKLALKIQAEKKLFDAWDNFLKFPVYKPLQATLENGYSQLATAMNFWVTNSQENIQFFKNKFSVNHLELIKNGANTRFLNDDHNVPEDLKKIKRPIIGFGGKISYLLDVELINYLTKDNPQASFVFVGQILDKTVFKQIIKRGNVHFLGDKHYDTYPIYVKNFDICIVPYKIKDQQHGGDSIKAYEYLLTGKKVVGTRGNGLLDLKKYLYLPKTKEVFSQELKNVKNEKLLIDPAEFSWENRARSLLKILTNGTDKEV